MSGSSKDSGFNREQREAQVGAFGESVSVPLVPFISLHFPYNVNPQLIDTTETASGTVTHSNQMIEVNSGAASSSSASAASKNVIEYFPGQGIRARWTTLYDTPADGNNQYMGLANATDGFLFGYQGTTFGIVRRSAGTDNFIAQSDWNVDKMDGTGRSGMTLDHTKGNIYQVKFQWLGYGAITFSIENENTGNITTVHTIEYSNQFTTPSIQNPTLGMWIESENTTNTTDVTVRAASFGAFHEGGTVTSSFLTHGEVASKAGVTTKTNIITLRNKSTYQGVTNEVRMWPHLISAAVDGTKNVTIEIRLNATLGGTPSYADHETNASTIEYDTAGTTVTGGELVVSFVLSKTGSDKIFVDRLFDSRLVNPGDTLTISAESVNTTDVDVAITWKERFS